MGSELTMARLDLPAQLHSHTYQLPFKLWQMCLGTSQEVARNAPKEVTSNVLSDLVPVK